MHWDNRTVRPSLVYSLDKGTRKKNVPPIVLPSSDRKGPSGDLYFVNLQEIEQQWKKTRDAGFPQKERDKLWALCNHGRSLLVGWRLEEPNEPLHEIKSVPAFERAIMLLEHEKRYMDALALCTDA